MTYNPHIQYEENCEKLGELEDAITTLQLIDTTGKAKTVIEEVLDWFQEEYDRLLYIVEEYERRYL